MKLVYKNEWRADVHHVVGNGLMAIYTEEVTIITDITAEQLRVLGKHFLDVADEMDPPESDPPAAESERIAVMEGK